MTVHAWVAGESMLSFSSLDWLAGGLAALGMAVGLAVLSRKLKLLAVMDNKVANKVGWEGWGLAVTGIVVFLIGRLFMPGARPQAAVGGLGLNVFVAGMYLMLGVDKAAQKWASRFKWVAFLVGIGCLAIWTVVSWGKPA